jgi:hypothetical protein
MLSYRRHFHCGSIPWYRNFNWSAPAPLPENDPWYDLPEETQHAWGTEFYKEMTMLICQQGLAQDYLPGYRKYNWDDPPNAPWPDDYPQNDPPWDDLSFETKWAWATEFYEEQMIRITQICQQGMHRITQIVGIKESMYSTLCQNLD